MFSSNHIQYIRHPDIDKQQWDSCIDGAVNGLIYAKSVFLDAMSPGWDALVYGNYEAVLPLTWRRKFGVTYLCQPAFSQQLGVFYTEDNMQKTVPLFLETIESRFRLIEIFLNYDNPLTDHSGIHQNYILPLSVPYKEIAASYAKDLKKNLKHAEKFSLHYKTSYDFMEAVASYKARYSERMNTREIDYTWFTDLVTRLHSTGNAFCRKATSADGELLACSVFLRDDKRIYNLASTTLPKGRTFEANHFLVDKLIQEFAGQPLLLDFEGSDIPGIASFYKNFTRINQPYFFWKRNRLSLLYRLKKLVS